MASSPAAAVELQPAQEQATETVRSPEVSAVDRASGEQEAARAFIQKEAAQTVQEVQRFGEIANDTEYPEAGTEAASVTQAAKTEVSAIAQKTESRIAAEMNPLPPVERAETVNTPEGEAKLAELEAVGEQAKQRMREIFAELMKMKESGGKLDAGEYETYKKMLDEDPVLNGFVRKIQTEFENDQNEGPVRAKAAELAGAFAEGARDQSAFAEQLARHGAEAVSARKPEAAAVVAGAVAAVSAESGDSKNSTNTEQPDAEESPSLKGLRAQSAELQSAMERAKTFGNSELYDISLEKLLKSKRETLAELSSLRDPSGRQKKEIEQLGLEIANYEKEKEIRVELAALKELEKEKKGLEAEIATLSQGDDAEALANANARLMEVNEKIAEKNQKINTLRGQQAGIENLFRTEAERQAKPVDIGEKIGSAAESLADTAIDIFKL